MTNKCKCGILISKTPYDKRYAIMEDGELAELIVDGGNAVQILGNIYKGIVKKVLAGKLAFVDIGLDADGVLLQEDVVDRNAPKGRDRDTAPVESIEKVLREGDCIMVQVSEEPTGKKGAALTMNLNLAGSLLVCMPGSDLIRVSKREKDVAKRSEIKRWINRNKGRDVGYIVRTEGVNASEAELTQQMCDLEAKWETIKDKFYSLDGTGCIYEESNSTQRAIGEYINENTDYVYIDNRDEYFSLRDDLKSMSPDKLDKVKLWSSGESLFEYFKVENDYARSLQRTVPLPRGGNLVIEQTAALVSIDVNTGPKVHGKDQGKIILETNIDACREIAKQLRLRDVDGLTIVDFIDMETEADNTTVYNEFCKAIRRDKAEVTPATISQFGLMEIKRKRVHTDGAGSKYNLCPVCCGGGRTATLESTLGMIDRWMARAKAKGNLRQVTLVTNPYVVDVLCKDRSRMFNYLEYKHGMTIDLIQDENAHVNQFWMYNENKEDITDLYNFADLEKPVAQAKPKAAKKSSSNRRSRRDSSKCKREILISKTPYEKRIAIMEDGELVELVVEGISSTRVLGNIYKGVVQKVLPALKAAFIDIGMEKAGFLHQEDAMDRNELLRREYGDDDDESGASKEISIDEILQEGQEIMVQVVKEPISTKGARLTTHLSFAGRFLVCMPGTNFVGVSKRERDPAKRREFKKVVKRLKGRDVGYIVRTNGLNESEFEINKQMRELESKWEQTKFNFQNQPAETCIYEESDSIEQTVREYFSDNTDVVYIDNREEYYALRDYLQRLSPDKLNKVKFWNEKVSLFENFKIENDYSRSLQRKVMLPSGGSLILEQTEALVSIKVNCKPNLEACNEACHEIAKQLRLRDVGGLIIIKFPEIEDDSVRDGVYQEFRKAIRRDKAPISPSPISQFGLMEVTRKRVRVNLMTEKTEVCSVCCGGGRIGTLTGTLGMIDRWLGRAHAKGRMREITLVVSPAVVDELCKNECLVYNYLEHKHGIKIHLVEDDHAHVNQFWMYDKDNEDITEQFNTI